MRLHLYTNNMRERENKSIFHNKRKIYNEIIPQTIRLYVRSYMLSCQHLINIVLKYIIGNKFVDVGPLRLLGFDHGVLYVIELLKT